jgi:hypothetical protein
LKKSKLPANKAGREEESGELLMITAVECWFKVELNKY